jgi:hypothetical protein
MEVNMECKFRCWGTFNKKLYRKCHLHDNMNCNYTELNFGDCDEFFEDFEEILHPLYFKQEEVKK